MKITQEKYGHENNQDFMKKNVTEFLVKVLNDYTIELTGDYGYYGFKYMQNMFDVHCSRNRNFFDINIKGSRYDSKIRVKTEFLYSDKQLENLGKKLRSLIDAKEIRDNEKEKEDKKRNLLWKLFHMVDGNYIRYHSSNVIDGAWYSKYYVTISIDILNKTISYRNNMRLNIYKDCAKTHGIMSSFMADMEKAKAELQDELVFMELETLRVQNILDSKEYNELLERYNKI
jgi:hypothetical protein